MRNKKSLIAFACGLILCSPLLTVQTVRSQERGSMPSGAQDPIAIYKEAGASDEQQQKIRELAKEFETGARVKVERAKNMFKKMNDLALHPDPDETSILATQTEINNLQAEMSLARIKLMLKIRSVLSADQRLKLVELMKQHQQSHKESPF